MTRTFLVTVSSLTGPTETQIKDELENEGSTRYDFTVQSVKRVPESVVTDVEGVINSVSDH